jgi:hypothetical protein
MLRTIAIAVVVAVLPAGPAAASDFYSDGSSASSPSGQSAGDQYVETLPTMRGPRAPRRHKARPKISKHLARQIESAGGSDAGALKALADFAAVAPAAKSQRGAKRGSAPKKPVASADKLGGGSTPAVPSAAIKAVDGGEAGIGWLVVALLAITALALGAAGYQRRRRGDTSS